MSKLLIVQNSMIVQGVFKEQLDIDGGFNYTLVQSLAGARNALNLSRYEFAVVERTLSDAADGKIIALLNKYNIAPLVFTKEIDEDFFESFEGARIVDYIIQDKHYNVPKVIKKLNQLKQNKKSTVLVVNDSHIYGTYLKQNLNLHSFKVVSVSNNEDAISKLALHPEIRLMVLEQSNPYVDAKKLIEAVKSDAKLEGLKILIIAEESNSYETAMLLNAGADDYVVKQFSRAEFYVRIYQNIR